MPNNITTPTPTVVMPANLSRAFHEELHLEADLNMYPDGSSDRNALALNNRRYFTMQQTLLPKDYYPLQQFFYNNLGRAFYFYNPRETVPPFTADPTGANTVGRYTVTFDGSWSVTYGNERMQVDKGVFNGNSATVSLGLREIL
jgi:hypothetical protein